MKFAADYVVRTERQKTALRQLYDAERAMIARWQRDLRAGVPTAPIANLPGANLYMFLSHEAEVPAPKACRFAWIRMCE